MRLKIKSIPQKDFQMAYLKHKTQKSQKQLKI